MNPTAYFYLSYILAWNFGNHKQQEDLCVCVCVRERERGHCSLEGKSLQSKCAALTLENRHKAKSWRSSCSQQTYRLLLAEIESIEVKLSSVHMQAQLLRMDSLWKMLEVKPPPTHFSWDISYQYYTNGTNHSLCPWVLINHVHFLYFPFYITTNSVNPCT